MKVEIWSDVMCPFCYIGKRYFEKALEQFPDRESLDIEWKSFQLDPTIPTTTDKGLTITDYLSSRKGIPPQQLEQMNKHVVKMAEDVGLDYNLSSVLIANSFKTHRVIQLAKEKGLGDLAEEKLFYAYFTQNRDLGDDEVLLEIGQGIGLKGDEIRTALTNDDYAYKVKRDIEEAQQIGVQGVPFFVFNRKYAVSGAQPAEAFLQTLEKSLKEWKSETEESSFKTTQGEMCTPDRNCG